MSRNAQVCLIMHLQRCKSWKSREKSQLCIKLPAKLHPLLLTTSLSNMHLVRQLRMCLTNAVPQSIIFGFTLQSAIPNWLHNIRITMHTNEYASRTSGSLNRHLETEHVLGYGIAYAHQKLMCLSAFYWLWAWLNYLVPAIIRTYIRTWERMMKFAE